MYKFFKIILTRVIISICLLYGLDLLVESLNIIIPINVLTISITSILGIPGVIMLIILHFIL